VRILARTAENVALQTKRQENLCGSKVRMSCLSKVEMSS
jgi:hypothetical protein